MYMVNKKIIEKIENDSELDDALKTFLKNIIKYEILHFNERFRFKDFYLKELEWIVRRVS